MFAKKHNSNHLNQKNYLRMKTKILLITLCFALQGRVATLPAQTVVSFNALQPLALMVNAGNDINLTKGQTISLGGSASGGAGHYTYAWSPSAGLNIASAANPSLTASTTTTYTLSVADASGCSATDALIITVNSAGQPSAVNDIEQGQVSIYPNPTTGNATLEFPACEGASTLTLLTYDGKLLWTRQVEVTPGQVKQEINLDTATPGIYLLVIKNGHGTRVQKIVKL